MGMPVIKPRPGGAGPARTPRAAHPWQRSRQATGANGGEAAEPVPPYPVPPRREAAAEPPSPVVTAEGRQGPGRLPRRMESGEGPLRVALGTPSPLCGTGRPPGAPGLWGQSGAEPLPTCLRDPRLDEFGRGAETLHIVTHNIYCVPSGGRFSCSCRKTRDRQFLHTAYMYLASCTQWPYESQYSHL